MRGMAGMLIAMDRDTGRPGIGPVDPELLQAEAAGPPAARPWIALGPEDAPAIVFLHGTRLTRTQWCPQLRRLENRFRCVAVDLPGHGRRAGERFTLDAAVAATIEAIDAEVPTGRVVLVGLSLGGYVAIETAVAHPDRVAGLVLAGCSAEAIGPTAVTFRLYAAALEWLPRTTLDRLNELFFRLRYPRAVARLVIDGGFWSVGGAQAVRSLVGRRFLERLGRLWTPVLVVNGGAGPGVRTARRPLGGVLSGRPPRRHPASDAPVQPRPSAHVRSPRRGVRGTGRSRDA